MSINIIKDDINELSRKSSKLVISFLDKKDLKSFSNKRKISNSVHSTFVDFMESQCSLIKNKNTRKIKRKVYFSDDETLPTCEITSLTYEIKHEVTVEEYTEIINYKDCYKNEDFLNGMRRRCEEQRIKQRLKIKKKRCEEQRIKKRNKIKIHLLNQKLQNMINKESVDGLWMSPMHPSPTIFKNLSSLTSY